MANLSSNLSCNGTEGDLITAGHSVLVIVSLCVCLGVIMVVTVVGNLFVIVAILREKELRRPQNYLILSLAFADLGVGVAVSPLSAINEVLQRWTLGTVMCEIWIFLDVLICSSSILHLVMIAFDRYWSVTSVYYSRNRTHRRMALMILIVWVVSLVVSVGPIVGWTDPDFEHRVNVERLCLISQDVGYQIFSTTTAFYAPLVLIVITYAGIYRAARKRIRKRYSLPAAPLLLLNFKRPADPVELPDDSQSAKLDDRDQLETTVDSPLIGVDRQPTMTKMQKAKKEKRDKEEAKREMKVFKTLAIVTGAFVACWLPFFVVALVRPLCHCDFNPLMVSIFNWLGWGNSMVNPVIYTIFAPDFRNAFRKILLNSCGHLRVDKMSQKASLNLKSKLSNNGTELDLSLSELTTVPTKEIATLKKLQTLDLSSNKLRLLPDDFGILTNVVKIDLSQNFLTALPDSFGLLTQLQHLDLYKNKLTDLPLSFGRLKKLQFLDVKDNPLNDDLKNVAGDCLDAKQCKTAATKVVQYLSELEDRRSKLEKQRRDKEAKARVVAEEAELERKREEKKKDKDIRRMQKTKGNIEQTESEKERTNTPEKAKSSARATAKDDRKGLRTQFVPPKRSKFSLCCQGLITVMITVGVLGLFGVFFVPQLCQPPRGAEPQWIYAKVFCDNVHQGINAIQTHVEGSPLAPMVEKISDGLVAAGRQIGIWMEKVDVKWIVDTMAIWFAEFLEWATVAKNWLATHGFDYLKNFGSVCSKVFTVVYNVTYDLVIWVADYCVYLVNNWPGWAEAWEKVKFYWANLK